MLGLEKLIGAWYWVAHRNGGLNATGKVPHPHPTPSCYEKYPAVGLKCFIGWTERYVFLKIKLTNGSLHFKTHDKQKHQIKTVSVPT